MTKPRLPHPDNETVRDYAPGSPERGELVPMLETVMRDCVDLPLFIGDEQRLSRERDPVVMPHRHAHRLAEAARATQRDVHDAIEAAQDARASWAAMPYDDRARIFLAAAELIAGPRRQRMNAATMLGQSKTVHQAEIDAVCELVDFLRFNAHDGAAIAEHLQPRSTPGVINTLELRPLDGFVFAVTPFNFTAIACNLPTAPALMGNTVIWKPAPTQLRAAYETMLALRDAGLPPGVINLVTGDAPMIGEAVLGSEHFAGLHFTGSTRTFELLFHSIGANLSRYHCYPRIVGETGGKDFIVAHPSADPAPLMTAIIRGGYEYQGQKCSAASRVFVPRSTWQTIREPLRELVVGLQMGDPADFSNFLGALIDEKAFDKVMRYVSRARHEEQVEVLAGGEGDKSTGYFVKPTLLRVDDPRHPLMTEEIFGPVVTVCVYPDDEYEGILQACESATDYALTGAVFATDRQAIRRAEQVLRFAAGNFYINDKPTGSVVGQQPFGGSRRSGTNDKAGSAVNLMRWASPRVIKETFVPATDHRYPSMRRD